MTAATVAFEVVLRTAGSGRTPTLRTIDSFRPDPEGIESGRRWLQAHGVSAHATAFSLACSAPPAVFETLFGVKLVALKKVTAGVPWRIEGTVQVPDEIAGLVEDIMLSRAPELF